MTVERVEYVEKTENPDDPCTFYFRKSIESDRPVFLLRDLAELAMMPFAFLITWLLPVRICTFLRRSAGLIRMRTAPEQTELQIRAAFQSVLGALENEKWEEIRRRQFGQKLAIRLAIAREFTSERCVPAFEVDGLAVLLGVLARREGAILWVNRFSYYPILSKRALFQQGVLALAVSHKCHGYTHSHLAELSINKMLIAIENCYLKERLVFDDGEEVKVQKRALMALKKGHPVLFTNSSYSGHRYAELPLGTSGKVKISTGPIAMALRMKVPLFSVSVFELEPFTRYRIEINLIDTRAKPNSMRDSSRIDYVTMARVARASRDIIRDGIRRYPDQSGTIVYEGCAASKHIRSWDIPN